MRKLTKLLLLFFILPTLLHAQTERDVNVIPDNQRHQGRFIPERRATDRTFSPGAAGAIWFNTTSNKWRGNNNSTIVDLGSGSGGGNGTVPNFACNSSTSKLLWNNTSSVFECGTDLNTGSSGTVTSFSAGTLSPLFTTSVSTSTTTPALSFAQISQSPNVVFAGPSSGSSANPAFRSLVAADIPAAFAAAVTNDTNITGSISGQNLTLGWTGTLAAARLNSNVVQAITNDTNVTGSISSQNLTLGWSGQLAVSRGGTGSANASDARTALGLAVGSDIQAFDADLSTFAGLAKTDNNLIVANGSTWILTELPSCSNATTSKLLYNATTRAFSCGTDTDTDTGITASSTDTLTNKTLDAEGTGNAVTLSFTLSMPFAGCSGATAGTIWDIPSSGAMVPTCTLGTNSIQGYGAFADGSSLSAQYTWLIPSDWSGALDFRGKWFTSATSGDAVFQIQTSCVADGETNDPSFNTASTVTDTAKGTTLQMNDFAINGVTTTGCAAGELMHIKFLRDSAHASDSLAATANVIGLEMKYRRAM